MAGLAVVGFAGATCNWARGSGSQHTWHQPKPDTGGEFHLPFWPRLAKSTTTGRIPTLEWQDPTPRRLPCLFNPGPTTPSPIPTHALRNGPRPRRVGATGRGPSDGVPRDHSRSAAPYRDRGPAMRRLALALLLAS